MNCPKCNNKTKVINSRGKKEHRYWYRRLQCVSCKCRFTFGDIIIVRKETSIKVPKKCLICGAKWEGGHEVPNKSMKEGLRVFYICGGSMSVKILNKGVYQILFKNCTKEV